MSCSAMAYYPAEKNSFCGQSCDDLGADFFDQFLTYSPVDNDGPDYSASPRSALPETSSSGHHTGSASSSSLDSDGKSWLADSSRFPQPSTQDVHFYSESTGRAAFSDSELLSLEGITLQSPRRETYSHPSLPCSPSPWVADMPRRRTRITECLSRKMKKAVSSLEKNLRSPIRKCTSSPKMMRNHTQTDLWGQKLEATKFAFDFEKDPPLSPSPSARVPQSSRMPMKIKNEERNGSSGFNNQLLRRSGNGTHETRLSSPILHSQNSRRLNSQPRIFDAGNFPPTTKIELAPSKWSKIPGSTSFNSYESGSMYRPESDRPLWWNHAATAPMAQPSPTALHNNPLRANRTLAMQLQNDFSYRANERAYFSPNIGSCLMIQMPGPSAQPSFVAQPPPRQYQGYFSPSQPPLHPRLRHTQAPSRHHQPPRPARKKRSGSSDSNTPSPKTSPAFHAARKRKGEKYGKSSTPRTPALGGAIDFVNYTPDDRRKILTGVAPSGSSKTKARREKEAMEKRRKLSQAAVRAVREAGGDVDSLVEQGLFV